MESKQQTKQKPTYRIIGDHRDGYQKRGCGEIGKKGKRNIVHNIVKIISAVNGVVRYGNVKSLCCTLETI